MVGEAVNGEESRAGFALGVDLGTSNTVAVVRWPDGRTRPLLFDGQPLLPSGVYLDPQGMLYAGRDAQRLAEAEPGRYEPNPKRRIDEPAVLLGDREVATADLLAAVLGTVARAAVEATGFLPPAALTHPASWGARRREVLTAAAARAGWPPPLLVPEPVAAARYFADVLRRPVPVGSSLAVFDFGGGTLDVAVVRNEGGHFVVLGSGGLPELGGLDLDAALVEHLGGLLSRSVPEAWQRLNAPTSAADQRARRRFWGDIRGAKEMLSRTSSAPVVVPILEQNVHLTREELERAGYPLLRRAVFEAGSVIAGCGLRPDQLAGLFLVGGSSRVPMVARLLHAELGIAPTVLEQPELPVAEGALAELVPRSVTVPAQPVPTSELPTHAMAAQTPVSPVPTSGAPTTGPPTSGAPISGTPTSGAPVPGALSAPPYPTKTPWYRRRLNLVAAGVVVLLLAVGGGYLLLRDDSAEVAFQALEEVKKFPLGEGANTSAGAFSTVVNGKAYMTWQKGDKLNVIAADVSNGRKLWEVTVDGSSKDWSGIAALPYAVLVFTDTSSGSDPRKVYALDPDNNGKQMWSRDFYDDDWFMYFDKEIVHVDRHNDRLVGLNPRTKHEDWVQEFPTDEYKSSDAAVVRVFGDSDVRGPANLYGARWDSDVNADHRIVVIGVDQKARVYDAVTGKQVGGEHAGVGDPGWWYRAYNGKLYVAQDDPGYVLKAYDLEHLETEPDVLFTSPDGERKILDMDPCGDGLMCLLDEKDSDDKTVEARAIDPEFRTQVWSTVAEGAEIMMTMGQRVLLTRTSSDLYSAILMPSNEDNRSHRWEMAGARISPGSALLFSDSLSSYGTNLRLTGVSAESGERTELGQVGDVRGKSCSWDAAVLVCANDNEYTIWRFARK